MNLNTLIEYSSGDIKFVIDTVKNFIKDSKHTLSQLKKYCKSKDWIQVNRLAHSLKSNYATFDMQEMRALAYQIEQDAKASSVDPKRIEKMIASLEQQTTKSYTDLKSQLMKLKK